VAKAAAEIIAMKHKVEKITYTQMGAEGLDLVAPLWMKLRLHHKERVPEIFKDNFGRVTFESRKKQLLEISLKGAILIDLARDNNTGNLVGYCVSSITENKQGEIESIYIEKDYRRMGIGDRFMKKALEWMDARDVTRKIIGVAVGNEEAFGFYAKYNFYPRVSILTQVETKE
jgi:diamine N-acetyltransferase